MTTEERVLMDALEAAGIKLTLFQLKSAAAYFSAHAKGSGFEGFTTGTTRLEYETYKTLDQIHGLALVEKLKRECSHDKLDDSYASRRQRGRCTKCGALVGWGGEIVE